MADLTNDQQNHLRQKLLHRQKVLIDEVKEKRERTAAEGSEDAMGTVGDAGDESVTRMNTDLSIQEAGRDMEELQDISAALGRIEEGSYGTCDECGREIDYRRLEAQPTAIRCITCQAQHEKTYAHKSTPTL